LQGENDSILKGVLKLAGELMPNRPLELLLLFTFESFSA